MSVFFTHIVSKNGLAKDPEGQKHDGLGEARIAALGAARSLIVEEVRRGHDSVKFELLIEDEYHVEVGRLPVSAEVTGLSAITDLPNR